MSSLNFTPNVSSLVDLVRKTIDEVVNEVFDQLRVEMINESKYLADIESIARDFISRGGKRVRPLLVLIGCWSVDWGRFDQSLKYLTSSVEFLHNYLLIHDDIMDRDVLRRGGLTVHAFFAKKCVEMGFKDCEHYGVSQAITVGDYLESMAVNMFSKLKLSGETLSKLLSIYTRGLRQVAYGQYLDVLLSNLPLSSVKEEDVVRVHTLKTASYTIELPLHIGAVACGGGEQVLKDMTGYAIPAGVAFQLQDDVLGLFGDERVTGKPSGSDVREKKKTLLVVKAYELSGTESRLFLEEIYDRRSSLDITDKDVEKVREIVSNTGSLSYVNRIIESKVNEARLALNSSSFISEQAKRVLDELLVLLTRREK